MKILIAGDFCPQKRVEELLDKEDYSSVLGEISEISRDYDYSIVNLECPIIDTDCEPIVKQGPNLSCGPKAVDAIRYAGFKCVTLANNHFRDYGDRGCILTMERLKELDVSFVGAGRNLEESQRILFNTINGKTLAIINVCEHEYSIATSKSAGSAPLDLIDLYNRVNEAKRQADVLIAIIHGGREYMQYPSPRLQKTYRWLIDIGVDVVINHHQHCYSGYELYNDKPIFYGLGNFCFDESKQMHKTWYEGYMVSLKIKNNICFEIIPYFQCKESSRIELMQNEEKDAFFSTISVINNVIRNPQLLNEKFEKYSETNFKSIRMTLTPYSTRLGLGLFRRGLLPSFITKKKLLQLQNMIECEARRDELELFFKKEI